MFNRERKEARRPDYPLVSTHYEAEAEQGLARGVYPLSMLSKALLNVLKLTHFCSDTQVAVD